MRKIVNFSAVYTADAATKKLHLPVIQDGITYYKLYHYQEKCLDEIQDKKYISINMPTGSGKTTIIMTHVYKVLEKDPKSKAIIVAPQRIILAGYKHYAYVHKEEKILFEPSPVTFLLNTENNVDTIKQFLSTKFSSKQIDSRILICTHQSITKTFRSLSPKKRKELFKNLVVWFDEAHHLSSPVYKIDDEIEIEANHLSKLCQEAQAFRLGSSHNENSSQFIKNFLLPQKSVENEYRNYLLGVLYETFDRFYYSPL